MTLADDLKAARALIDTPEKLTAYHSMTKVFRAVTGDDASSDDVRFIAMFRAISSANDTATPRGIVRKPHANIMALFDRAIAKAKAAERSAP